MNCVCATSWHELCNIRESYNPCWGWSNKYRQSGTQIFVGIAFRCNGESANGSSNTITWSLSCRSDMVSGNVSIFAMPKIKPAKTFGVNERGVLLRSCWHLLQRINVNPFVLPHPVHFFTLLCKNYWMCLLFMLVSLDCYFCCCYTCDINSFMPPANGAVSVFIAGRTAVRYTFAFTCPKNQFLSAPIRIIKKHKH